MRTFSRQPSIPFVLVTVVVFFSAVLDATPAQSAAAGAAPEGDSLPLVFRLASDVLPTGGIQLANGIVVRPRDWNTIILAQMPAQAGAPAASCSGTLVGPNVVLMAGHCVDSPLYARPRKSVLELDGGRIELACEIHPDYLKHAPAGRAPRGSEDYALCLLDAGKKAPPSLAALSYEIVDTTALARGDNVLMTGYGCSALKVVGGELVPTISDTTLRIGDGKIETPASGAARAPAYVTIRSADGLRAALCPGDSGGPLMSGVTASAQNGPRRVRGVNSAVASARRGDGGYDLISSIAATGTPQFRVWAEDWLARHSARSPIICGVNRKAGAPPCRD